jgi:hypothetical protein
MHGATIKIKNLTHFFNVTHKINSLFLSLQDGFNNVGSEQFLSSRRQIYKSNSYKLRVEKGTEHGVAGQ